MQTHTHTFYKNHQIDLSTLQNAYLSKTRHQNFSRIHYFLLVNIEEYYTHIEEYYTIANIIHILLKYYVKSRIAEYEKFKL